MPRPRPRAAQIFHSRFYNVFRGERNRQLGELMQATRLSPPIDVAFQILKSRREAAGGGTAGGHGGGGAGGGGEHSALQRVAFE